MTYGKTQPFEMVCTGCGQKKYGQRKNKKDQKKSRNKYCSTERKTMKFTPKKCGHNNK